MTRIRDAVEQISLPDLIEDVCGPQLASGWSVERGGVIRDPRPGHEERHPSFSVFRSKHGCWRWKRFGGDDAGGDAYDFLLQCGYSPAEARRELETRANLPGASTPLQRIVKPPSIHALPTGGGNFSPLSEDERHRLTRLVSPLDENDPGARELARRGLWGESALDAGKLTRPFRTRAGKVLAHRGALALTVGGPDGRPWGLKVRNAGTAEELRTRSLERYVYRLKGHGSPAWCSPRYGQGSALLLVEGELNAVAAHRALRAAAQFDVQGLAGASAWPHVSGLASRVVYLYTDDDRAGRDAQERLARLAYQEGASDVRSLPFLPVGRDFCDLLGKDGVSVLRAWLLEAIDASASRQPGSERHPETASKRAAPSGQDWGLRQWGKPARDWSVRSWEAFDRDA
ncbi:hypothetical protein [Deinococcus yavapaiensis]|uniref:Putative DNA primase/helicase n=1 Tax=Deinococcus yavapaiensis KR-236 TaxID=694435 RepID=A0A318SDL6_9DEIO|nr:hypothetical protein [Deinococcus yavapaiensis]PYE55484.1 putative DNA primase/helicase [Deinococcus yavapaiensis KR-236]